MESKKYNEYYYGKKVSDYALQNGYVDYRTLSNVVGDCVLCNAMEKRLYTKESARISKNIKALERVLRLL